MNAKEARIEIQKLLFPDQEKEWDGFFGPKTEKALVQLKAAKEGLPWPLDKGLTQIDKIGTIPIFGNTEGKITFTAGATINADGSPHAYHPDNNKGLDYLANAGSPGNWWGIATDSRGKPYIQDSNDPAPGYYVSTTAHTNPGFEPRDPRRYIDSEKVPFMVLPGGWRHGDKLGDEWLIENLDNGRSVEAIYADIGPRAKIGEISIAAAEALGIPSNPKNGGASKAIVRYTQLG